MSLSLFIRLVRILDKKSPPKKVMVHPSIELLMSCATRLLLSFSFLSITLTNRTALRKRAFAHASSSIEDDCTDTPSFIEKRTFFFFFNIETRKT